MSFKRIVKVAVVVGLGASSLTAMGYAPTAGVSKGQKISFKPELIKNWGLANFQGKSHISAVDAWTIEKGSHSIVVAVIDTGVDATHKDLEKNIWHDPSVAKDQPAQYGWNYVLDKANPIDDHGHGTHVAGIIGAMANPVTGVSGVTQNVSIMAVKYYSDSNPGSVNLKNTIKAINFAVDHGARIINYSGGGPEFSEDEYLAIKKAEAKGVLFVAAAGNEHQDTDVRENYYYPSAYKLTNIISVAATDINNNLLRSSNWGKTKVDVAAPGENIFSTLPNGRYGYMSGTSQATAFVSGIAALLLSKNPSLTPVQLKEIIRKSVDSIPGLQGKLATGGRVNAYKALLALGGPAPVLAAEPEARGFRALAQRPLNLLKLIDSGSNDSVR
ncbi:MAG: S8 family serine peptidase [Methylotenera sp.]|nr:S8 family serine peptidase [Oligoflexia bacterium]